MCPGRGQMSSTGADRTEPAPRTPCQQTHTAFSLSRPGGVAVPCCIASIGLHSEVIQYPQLLLTRCPQPSVYTVKVTFNVIQGHRYWCHSIGHVWFSTSLPLWLYVYLVPLLRISTYFVEILRRRVTLSAPPCCKTVTCVMPVLFYVQSANQIWNVSK